MAGAHDDPVEAGSPAPVETRHDLPSAGTVVAVETARVSLMPNPALVVRGAAGAHDRSDFLLVRVHTSLGATGCGEVSATPRWSGEDGVTAEHFIREVLAPAVVGQPVQPIANLSYRMGRALAGNPFTKAGLNIACWDALGRTLGRPVVDLLGGARRTSVPIKMSLSGDGEVLDRVVAAARELGVEAFKVKVGLDVAADVTRFARARELLGRDTFLGADANGGWTTDQAIRAVGALAPFEPAFIEQPVAPDDVPGMAAVRAAAIRLGLPVMADESVYTAADVRRLVEAGATDLVNVYVGKAGGMEAAVHELDLAASLGIGGIVGSNGEMGLGAAAQIHVACAAASLAALPSDIIGHLYYDEDILRSPVPIDGRRASLPGGPGLGVEPSAAMTRRFA